MHKHNSQRQVNVRERGHRIRSVVLAVVCAGGLFLPPGWRQAETTQSSLPNVEGKLAQRVVRFDNHGAPLIPTLLRVAATYSLPMGIEKVVPRALEKPVTVRVDGGDVASLLALCVRQIPGYAWMPEDGVVDIFGHHEKSEASNLFNLVVPSFEVRDQTIDAASEQLRRVLVMEVLKPRGIVGSYLGSTGLETKRFSFALRQASVRQVLNYMVALNQGAVWVARVRPGCLSRLPQRGIWVVLPHSVQDLRGMLDLRPCRSR